MAITLAELAEMVGGRLSGPPDVVIHGTATLELVGPGEITLADHAERSSRLSESQAAAAIVSEDVESPEIPTVVVDDVHEAFAKVVPHFRPQRSHPRIGVSEQAFVSTSAQLSDDVEIHPGATIGDDVIVGTGTIIHSGARIMAGCVLGSDVTVYPNAVIYEDCVVGDRCLIHAGVVIGANGFGYRRNEGHHELSAQLGNVVIGSDVEIGACATIDRGTYGATTIGDGTKIDNLVQIAHNCRLGKHNLICGQVGIAGTTTTGDFVVMAGQVGVRDHVHIGTGAVLCSKAGVSNNVNDGEVMLGQPATPLRKQKLQMAAISKLPDMRREFRILQRQLAQLQQQLDSAEETPADEQAA